ncbi:hypothetical protein N9A28_04585 [Sulfurimonas sp.]|nr:hypothetical protein [Sulfurimonas sp.]
MKVLFISFMLLISLHGDEMQRIEAIVQDIVDLREDYEECTEKLENSKKQKVYVNTTSDDRYKALYEKEKRKNSELNGMLTHSSNLELTNSNLVKQIKNLKQKISGLQKSNDFPKLIMKNDTEDTLITFKATSFHLNTDSIIYNEIDGDKVGKWVESTSFTSSIRTNSWIKITGYFVDRKWRAAKDDMWVKLSHVTKK